MIQLQVNPINSIGDAYDRLQTAIALEFSTLPPYLYASFSIPNGQNPVASKQLSTIVGQEMIHMCLACNIMNAIGGDPKLTAPTYPGSLPGDIGKGGKLLTVHLLRFSPAAMKQGMNIEEPVSPIIFKSLADDAVTTETIGQFYERLRAFLKTLPASAWQANRNQITDDQFMAGQLFAVNSFLDASSAIDIIISEGEGSSDDPLDFQKELSHYYRFQEMHRNQLLTKDSSAPHGFRWGGPLGVDWTAVYPAIPNPGQFDFSKEPIAVQAAQEACNAAFRAMVDALQLAVTGHAGQLGVAVRHMFDLRTAALQALNTPMANGKTVAGPAFLYT
jgi:hypothetical protein